MISSEIERAWAAGTKAVLLHPDSRYSLNDGEALVAAAVAGLGLIQCHCDFGYWRMR